MRPMACWSARRPFGGTISQRRRLEGVTVVSIDTNRKVAAELFVRLAGVAQAAKSPASRNLDAFAPLREFFKTEVSRKGAKAKKKKLREALRPRLMASYFAGADYPQLA